MKRTAIGLMVLALVGCGKNEVKATEVKPVEVAQVSPASKSLGVTPDTFKTGFNLNMETVPDLKIRAFELTDGSVQNTYSYKFNSGLSVLGAVDKTTGFIKDVGVIIESTPKNFNQELFFAQALAVVSVSGKTLDPNNHPLFLDAMNVVIKEASTMDGEPHVGDFGTLKLTAIGAKGVGFMFNVEPLSAQGQMQTTPTAVPSAQSAGGAFANKEKFTAIKSGMSESQAYAIMGGEGDTLSESNSGGLVTSMHMWKSEDGYGNMNIMFQRGVVVNKAQAGLKE